MLCKLSAAILLAVGIIFGLPAAGENFSIANSSKTLAAAPAKADPAKSDAAKGDSKAKTDPSAKNDAPPVPPPPTAAKEAKRTPTKAVPENLDDLQHLQEQVEKVVTLTRPATVGVQVGSAQGSGVIVTKDGYVLTAGHVVGEPGRDVTFIFPDGKRVHGKTLGVNHDIDSGLMKITDPGDYPHVEMGKSSELKPGDWIIVTGHPGGYRSGRPPVVRLGRLIQNRNGTMQTDAPLVGGDSGGPVFDLDGKVVGINSRISGPLTTNFHVPVDTFRDTWDRLAKSEEWGELSPRSGGAMLGVTVEPNPKGCKIAELTAKGPAQNGGLKVGDIIVKFDGKAVPDPDALQRLLLKKKPGNEVKVELLRGDDRPELKVVLGKRP
ncbi:MAG TPA: S1C family serine protease [Pirellulales bacterium]|jgi:serine protease Do|nr:S1C family serine protease [Pirellulales bacterium]